MLLYQLLRPLSYMEIRDASKWKIDVLLPIIFTIIITVAIGYMPIKVQVFGQSGLMTLLIGLLQILPGFYLTALAAVATFNRPDMDLLLPKPIPTIKISVKGKSQDIELTRRRMLSMLFGYLTFISFSLYFLAVSAQVVAPSVASIMTASEIFFLRNIFLLLFLFLLGQLIFITMFGLYQLSDRMHQPD